MKKMSANFIICVRHKHKKESATRRNLKAETNPTGKANQFFAGKPVVPARPILA